MIRRMQPGDLDQILLLWFRANRQAHFYLPKEYFEKHIAPVRQALLHSEVHVQEAGGKIQGFIGLMDHYIAGIFVDSSVRSQGIGRNLLEAAKKNRRSLTLHVYQRNIRAVRFYLREGFSISQYLWEAETGLAEWAMEWRKNPAPP